MEDLEKVKQNYINSLYDDYGYSIEKFDKQALYISSGALAISITFLKDIVPIKDSIHLPIYYLSLIFFSLTILVGFIAHYISAAQIKKRIIDIEEGNKITDNNHISILNIIVIITLFLGISFIVFFTISNMSKAKSRQTTDSGIKIEKVFDNGSVIKLEGDIKNCNFIDTLKNIKR
ncbi:MAG: hypothetical protein N4A72_13120 [Bacteroidales bacterium]|jgi:heme/copper-type cytochrome/quinol oxidase subunit 2|nr:hypothetical protein [Bacteroidales bacterium]